MFFFSRLKSPPTQFSENCICQRTKGRGWSCLLRRKRIPRRGQMTELCTQRDLNCLSDPDRSTRKRALEKISKDVQARKGKPDFTPDVVKQNLDLLHKPLLKTIKDPAEKCRELSVTILGALMPLVTAKDVEAIAGEVRTCLGPNLPPPPQSRRASASPPHRAQ